MHYQIVQTPITAIPSVEHALCKRCQPCIARKQCRTKALTLLDRDEPPYVDASRCYACYQCVIACPHGAILAPAMERSSL